MYNAILIANSFVDLAKSDNFRIGRMRKILHGLWPVKTFISIPDKYIADYFKELLS